MAAAPSMGASGNGYHGLNSAYCPRARFAGNIKSSEVFACLTGFKHSQFLPACSVWIHLEA
jgi:hypothetical protein